MGVPVEYYEVNLRAPVQSLRSGRLRNVAAFSGVNRSVFTNSSSAVSRLFALSGRSYPPLAQFAKSDTRG